MELLLPPSSSSNDTSFLLQKMDNWERIVFENTLIWMNQNWSYSLYFACLYVLLIHWGQVMMKEREPFKLKRVLMTWNVILAVFSIIGFLRTFPELFASLSSGGSSVGFYKSVCSREFQTTGTGFWSLMATWSKVAELMDTGFVVMRKQPLIFLHWYHHTTVMLFSWFTHVSLDPSSRWMMVMNLFIHSLMYSYYALKAAGFKIPTRLSIVITSLQILQMVVGVTINVYTIVLKRDGVSCGAREDINVFLGLAMYCSYFVLFAKFFYDSYVGKGKRSRVTKKMD